MKKFVFPLDRVLEWRKTRVRLEEIKLERVQAELFRIQECQRALSEECAISRQNITTASSATGAELRALDSFTKSAAVRAETFEKKREECAKRVAVQREEVTRCRRDVRLLERLRQQRFRSWTTAFNREIEQDAAESHLARWNQGRTSH